MHEKWSDSPAYQPALAALRAITREMAYYEMKNPTYTQVMEILECMRDLAIGMCEFNPRK